MVSYYNPAAMYRHQQAVAANSQGHFQNNAAVHTWYPSGYHQGAQAMAPNPTNSYCIQEEQQMWHGSHPAHPPLPYEFSDFMHSGLQIPPHQHIPQNDNENAMPSPPITVSGSEMSSPGAGGGNNSPQNHNQNSRPPPARSPYEWIKKTSYQSQPNPGKTRTKDKYRVVYTDHQRIELEKEFTFNNKYITIRRKSELAANLGLSERQIKIWFQNRRAKERKQNKKRVEEKNQIDMVQQQQLFMSSQGVLPPIVPPVDVMNNRFMKIEKLESDHLG